MVPWRKLAHAANWWSPARANSSNPIVHRRASKHARECPAREARASRVENPREFPRVERGITRKERAQRDTTPRELQALPMDTIAERVPPRAKDLLRDTTFQDRRRDSKGKTVRNTQIPRELPAKGIPKATTKVWENKAPQRDIRARDIPRVTTTRLSESKVPPRDIRARHILPTPEREDTIRASPSREVVRAKKVPKPAGAKEVARDLLPARQPAKFRTAQLAYERSAVIGTTPLFLRTNHPSIPFLLIEISGRQ